jgi:hypothetical protein
MALLTKIEVGPPAAAAMGATPKASTKVTLDVGKTLGLVILSALVLVLAFVLYLKNNGAAGAFFALGEAILTGGLGVAIGENSGAKAATDQLQNS